MPVRTYWSQADILAEEVTWRYVLCNKCGCTLESHEWIEFYAKANAGIKKCSWSEPDPKRLPNPVAVGFVIDPPPGAILPAGTVVYQSKI